MGRKPRRFCCIRSSHIVIYFYACCLPTMLWENTFSAENVCCLRLEKWFSPYVFPVLSDENSSEMPPLCLTSVDQRVYFGRSTCLLRPFNVFTSTEVRQTHLMFWHNTSDLLANSCGSLGNFPQSKAAKVAPYVWKVAAHAVFLKINFYFCT